MVEVACPKCGTKVPEGGKFCLSCGVPIVGRAANPPPAPAPAPVQPMKQMGGLLDTLFSKTFIILGALLGILLVWIGNMIFNFGVENLFTKGEFTITHIALILNSLGFAVIIVFLIGGGISNKNLDKYIRLGMILGGIFLLGMNLAVSWSGLISGLAAYRV